MKTVQIKHKYTNAVLFECEVPDDIGSGLCVRHALEKANAARAYLSGADFSGANLSGAYLSGAYLSGANFSDADLSGANLSGAYLSGANLSGADFSGANLSGAYLSDAFLAGANFSDADLSDANLSPIKTDFFDVLLRAPREVPALRAALLSGRVDGSTYEGECACLVGTIANARHADHRELGAGLKPDLNRPAERFFLAIREGDTPETNGAAKIAVEWIDEFAGLIANAREAA